MDLVCAFEFDEWPYFICRNWIYRNHMTWPSRDTAFRISFCGLSLVPKSSSYGNSNLEWRLSFSAQEKELCMELTSAQKIVYKYLKFLAIEHFNKAKILHSYHLTTVFFWTLQTLPPEKKMGKSSIGRESYRFIWISYQMLKSWYNSKFFYSSDEYLRGHFKRKIGYCLKKCFGYKTDNWESLW